MIQSWTDQQIIDAIQGKDKQREEVFRYLLHHAGWKEQCMNFVIQNGGDEEAGKEVFQETIVLFDRNIRFKQFEGRSTLNTYLMSIVKRRWWKMIATRKAHESFDAQKHSTETVESGEDLMLSKEKKQYIGQIMEQIGTRCKEILRLQQLDYSLGEIANLLQLSSAAMAKKEAYRCRMRLRSFMETHPFLKNFFK